jgi:hypothetical protein
MPAALVRNGRRWIVEAPAMRYTEIINIGTMMGKLLDEGELVEVYKVENCDRCGNITKLDEAGYQKSTPTENVIWFCLGCR